MYGNSQTITPSISRSNNDDFEVNYDHEVEKMENEDFKKISKGLKIILEFVTSSKDNLSRKKDCTDAIQSVQMAVTNIFAELESKNTAENIKEEIVKAINESITSQQNKTTVSYAQALTLRKNINVDTSSPISGQKEKKYKAIIYPLEGSVKPPESAEETKNALLKLNPRILGVKPDRLVKVKDKGVLIESSDPNLVNLLKSKQLRDANLIAKVPEKNWPKVIIYGVPRNLTEKEMLNEVYNHFPENLISTEKWYKKVFKVGSKDVKHNQNWVIEINPEARKFLKLQGKVYFEWRACGIEDFINISRCFKCQRFGHVAKFCNSIMQCGYCSGTDHESIQCPLKQEKTSHKCTNCIRSGKKIINHDAGSKSCQIYQNRLTDYLNNIDYGNDD